MKSIGLIVVLMAGIFHGDCANEDSDRRRPQAELGMLFSSITGAWYSFWWLFFSYYQIKMKQCNNQFNVLFCAIFYMQYHW